MALRFPGPWGDPVWPLSPLPKDLQTIHFCRHPPPTVATRMVSVSTPWSLPLALDEVSGPLFTLKQEPVVVGQEVPEGKLWAPDAPPCPPSAPAVSAQGKRLSTPAKRGAPLSQVALGLRERP